MRRMDLSFCLFVLGIAIHFNVAFAEIFVEMPKKWFAPRGSRAEIPCITNSDGSHFTYFITNTHRLGIFNEMGDPNLMILSINDLKLSDTGKIICKTGSGQKTTLDLIVYEPTYPVIAVEVTPSNDVKVTWSTPEGSKDIIEGYKIYVKEVADQVGVATFEVMGNSNTEEQQFLLEDLKPGATYDIQVAATYLKGPDDEPTYLEGPKSAKVRIDTPQFSSPPVKVKASPWANSSILVTWKEPTNIDPNAIDGYKVVYKAFPTKKNSKKGEVDISSRDNSNQWRAILKGLPTKTRYEIAVYAVQNSVLGKKSQSVYYRHEGFAPELSINAFPLSADTALVSVRTVGSNDVSKLRVLYSDDTATKWTRINDCGLERHCVVSGLKPESKYFFIARARVAGKSRHVVTHITTLPLDMSTPLDLTVKAMTDHSIRASWLYPGKTPPIGYILMVEVKETDDQEFRQFKQEVVYDTQTATMDGLRSYDQYRARVIPFNVNGKGNPSETVLFTISAEGVEGTTEAPKYNPPRFIETPSTFIQIDAGENATLTCIAIGDPHPLVQWTSNGSIISQPQDRTNILYLYNVQESKTITCKAENDYGKIYHEVHLDVSHGLGTFPTTTEKKSSPLRESYELPTLAVDLPKQIVKTRGEYLRILCRFSGQPEPSVTWFKDDFPAAGGKGESILIISSVQSSSELACVGVNSYGQKRHTISLVVMETTTSTTTTTRPNRVLLKPTLVDELPTRVTKKRDEALSMRCRFNGNPPPIVTWYQNNRPIGEGSQWESVLSIPSVKSSSTLKCEGENYVGSEEHVIQLIVEKKPVDRPKLQDYKVSLRYIPVTRDSAVVKWVVDEGDIQAIRYFNVTILGVNFPMTIMKDIVSHDTRRLTLTRLNPDVRYAMKVETMTTLGVVNVATMEFQPSEHQPLKDEPVLLLEAVEIRHNSARIDFTSLTQARRFRLRVKDLEVRRLGNTILDRNLDPLSPSINLQRLKPNREYEVILDAIPARGGDKISSSVKFMTVSPGQAGVSVASRSDQEQQTTRAFPTTEARSETTTTTRVLTTTTTTTAKPTTTRRFIEETTTDSADDGSGYELKLRITYKTSSQIDVRWTINKGDLDAIDNFLFTIKGSNGFNLLQQELNGEQRSITIQSLVANSRYFVDVKARSPNKAVLAEADIIIHTLSNDAVRDNRNSYLEVEANEIRSSSARIEWVVINGNPSDVSEYTLRVLNKNANGVNLLTKNMAGNSQSLNLRSLPSNRQYHVIVDALDQAGQVKMTSSLTFSTAKPGRYGTPVRSSGHSPEAPEELNIVHSTQAPDPKSFLQMDIIPSLPFGARLIFTQESNVRVKDFKVVVKTGDPDGKVFFRRYLPWQARSMEIAGLLPDEVYYIEAQTRDRFGLTLAKVKTSYRLPPPGHNVEVIRVASNDTDGRGFPVITEISPLNSTTAILRWRNAPSLTNFESVIIRYSEYTGGVKQPLSAKVTYSQAMPGKIVVIDLKPRSVYGFQIARLVPHGQAVKWTPVYYYNT